MNFKKKVICKLCQKVFEAYPNSLFCNTCKIKRNREKRRIWANENYDREKGRIAATKYRKKFHKHHKEYMKTYREKNKKRINFLKKQNRFKRIFDPKIHFIQAKNRCTVKTNKYYIRGIKFCLTLKDVKFLFKRDNASKMYYPSLDRINGEKHYTLKNCRFIECYENCNRNRSPFWAKYEENWGK